MRRSGLMSAASVALSLMASAAFAQDMKNVAISTIVEVPQLVESRLGALEALAERGFVEGKNLTVDYQNANGNMPTQQQIAKKFVGNAPDVILAITTPTAQAMAAATKDIPIVFVTVTDPLKASLITQYEKPGHNITGVSDAAPIGAQLDMFKEVVPDLKKIGFIYNPGLDNSVATLEQMKKAGAERGIEVIDSPAPTTNEITLATRKLIGNVGAIYIPNDTTIVTAIEAIVKIGQDVKLPVFTGETGGVKRGALGSVGLDYMAVGRLAGNMVADVLEGAEPGQIDSVIAYQVADKFKVVINRGAAQRMGIELPESVLAKATEVVD